MTSGSPPWWTTAFAADYPIVYAHRTAAQAAEEIAGLLPHLPAGPILDAGCGNGRHLAALRQAGRRALGFDLSPELLACARAAVPGLLARADQRRLPFADAAFAAVLVLFTGFGYFDDAENAAALTGLGRIVQPGGLLLLDLPDPARLAASLVPASERIVRDAVIRERRRLVGDHVEKEVRIARPGQPEAVWTERVRLYGQVELAALARAAGLTHSGCWSGLNGPADPAGRLVHWLRR